MERSKGLRVTIEEAKRFSTSEPVMIWWRPEPNLTEDQQYALVFGG